jgi:hypothetical protein
MSAHDARLILLGYATCYTEWYALENLWCQINEKTIRQTNHYLCDQLLHHQFLTYCDENKIPRRFL